MENKNSLEKKLTIASLIANFVYFVALPFVYLMIDGMLAIIVCVFAFSGIPTILNTASIAIHYLKREEDSPKYLHLTFVNILLSVVIPAVLFFVSVWLKSEIR